MWFKIKRSQEALKYNFFDDTSIYKNYVDKSAEYLNLLIDNEIKLLSSQRFHEIVLRLDSRYCELKKIEDLILNTFELSEVDLHRLQIELVNKVEAYYQQLYASISALAMLINHLASHEFKQKFSIKGLSKFFDFLKGKDINISEEILELERGIYFRNKFVDHIQQHSLHDWLTFTLSTEKGGQCVVIYYIKATEDGIPTTFPSQVEIDPYEDNFKLPFNYKSFYVSPPQDNCHKAFFQLTKKLLIHLAK